MNLLLLSMYFFITAYIQDISAFLCHETLEKEDLPSSFSFRYSYSSISRISAIITSSTLTCANVSSITNLHLLPFNIQKQQRYPQFMKITNSNISDLPNGVFLKFHQISKLDLNGIHLKTIHSDAFGNMTELHTLILDNNELTEITDIFKSLHKLRQLYLRHNKITRIDDLAFQNNTFLNSLYLDHNFLTKFDDNLLRNQKILEILDLSFNPLGKIPTVLNVDTLQLANISLTKFEVYQSFNTLNLRLNQLESFDCKAVTENKITRLILSHNQISSVENMEFLNIAYIYFNDNKIKILNGSFGHVDDLLDLSGNELAVLEEPLIKYPKFITDFYLSRNEIATISQKFFLGMINLQILKLDHNRIQTLPLGIFQDLKELKKLDLSSNQIEEFQFGIFSQLTVVEFLDISNNKLLDLNPHAFTTMTNLNYLNFSHNLISSLDVDFVIDTFSHLKNIFLEHNLWRCKDLVLIFHKFSRTDTEIRPGEIFDKPNAHGVACIGKNTTSKNSSFEEFYTYVRGVINHQVDKSEMKNFLEKNDKEVFLPEKISEESENQVSVAISIIQIIIACLLLLVVSLVYVFLKKINLVQRSKIPSRLELVGDD